MTKVRAMLWEAVDPQRLGACLFPASPGERLPESRVVVERVGVNGESISFRDAGGRTLIGCDSSLGPREDDHIWCGGAAGELANGRVRDPRLDLGCQTRDRKPLAFAWINPLPRARWIVVDQPRLKEVYKVVARLPVRVTTTSGVELDHDRATFTYTQYDADGKLLRRMKLEAAVAG